MALGASRLEVFNGVLDAFGEPSIFVINQVEQAPVTVRFLTPDDNQSSGQAYTRRSDDYSMQGVNTAKATYLARALITDLHALPDLKSGDIAYIRGGVYRITKICPGLVSADIYLIDTGGVAP